MACKQLAELAPVHVCLQYILCHGHGVTVDIHGPRYLKEAIWSRSVSFTENAGVWLHAMIISAISPLWVMHLWPALQKLVGEVLCVGRAQWKLHSGHCGSVSSCTMVMVLQSWQK